MSDALLLRLEVVMKYATVIALGLTGSSIVAAIAYGGESFDGLLGTLFATFTFATLGSLWGTSELGSRREEALMVLPHHTFERDNSLVGATIPISGDFRGWGIRIVIAWVAAAVLLSVITVVATLVAVQVITSASFDDESTEFGDRVAIPALAAFVVALEAAVTIGIVSSVYAWAIEPRMIALIRSSRPHEQVWANITSSSLRALALSVGSARRLRAHTYVAVNNDYVTIWHREGRSLVVAVALRREQLRPVLTSVGSREWQKFGVQIQVTSQEGTSPVQLSPRPFGRVSMLGARAHALLAALTTGADA